MLEVGCLHHRNILMEFLMILANYHMK